MILEVKHVSNRVCEVSVNEIRTGLMNSKEAKELAIDLINVAAELLSVEGRK